MNAREDDWDPQEIARQVATLREESRQAVRALFRGFREGTITPDDFDERRAAGGLEAVSALLVERGLLDAPKPWHCPAWCTVGDEEHQRQADDRLVGRNVTHTSWIDDGPTPESAIRIEAVEAIDPGATSWGPGVIIGEEGGSALVPDALRRVIENLQAALADLETAEHFTWCDVHDDEDNTCVSAATDVAHGADGSVTVALWLHELDGRPVIAVDASPACEVTPDEAQRLAEALPALIAAARAGR